MAVAVAGVLWAGPAVYELQVLGSRVPRYVPVWEVAPAVAGSVVPALLAPRMWSWERVGDQRRIRVCALLSGAFCLLLPAAITVMSGLVVLPADARWHDVAWNVVLVTSVAMFGVIVAGRVAGPLVALATYLGLAALQQMVPSTEHWVPLSAGGRSGLDQAAISLPVAVVALMAWTITLGRSALADRLSID